MSDFLKAIPKLIGALPVLMALAVKVIAILEQLVTWAQANSVNEWLDTLSKHFDELNHADSKETKSEIAKNISDHLRTLF